MNEPIYEFFISLLANDVTSYIMWAFNLTSHLVLERRVVMWYST